MRTKARLQMRLGTAALAALVVAGCGGGEGTDAGHEAPESVQNAQRRQALASATTATSSVRPVGTTALLDWAERNYPQFFPGHQDDQSLSPYTYRYYPQTGNYVGVADGRAVIYGPVSGGALTDVGAVSDFRCLVYALDCQPNPLLTAKWQTGVLLESGDETPTLEGVGIDDSGRATVLFRQGRNGVTRLFASQTLPPDANGMVGWTAQQPLDDAAEFGGVMSSSGVDVHLKVAANGVAIALWSATGRCLPGTYGYDPTYANTSCNYLMANRFDPASGDWSGAIRIFDIKYADLFRDDQVDSEGNFAVIVYRKQTPFLKYWGRGSEQLVSVELPANLPDPSQLAMTGEHLVLAGGSSNSAGRTVVAYRGTVTGGFRGVETLSQGRSDTRFQRLMVSPKGRAVVSWTQTPASKARYMGSATVLADAASPSAPFLVAEQGPDMSWELQDRSDELTFNDAGEMVLPPLHSACAFHRHIDGRWIDGVTWAANGSPCWYFAVARNRNGDFIGEVMSNWFVVDSRSETLSRPAGMGSITAGASGIVKTALSVNGTAVYVTTPNYDVLPTPDQPAGKSRRGVYNLFAWVLR